MPPPPASFDVRAFTGDQGFAVEFAHAWRIAPFLGFDLDYHLAPTDQEASPGFVLQRARVGLRLSVFDAVDATFIVRMDRGPVRVYEAHVTANLPAGFRIEAGLSRSVLFITGRDEFESWMPMLERPVPSDALWPARSLGLMVAYRGSVPIEAFFRIANDATWDTFGTSVHPALEGRLDLVLGRQHRDPDAFWGLRLGGAAHWEPNAALQTGISGTTEFDYAFWTAPNVKGERLIAEGHVVGDIGPVELRVEGGWAREARVTTDDPTNPQPLDSMQTGGAMAELAWRTFGAWRLPSTWPGGKLTPTADGWKNGAVEIAVRVERIWLGQGASDVVPEGMSSFGAAVRWWSSWGIGASLAGFGYLFDTAPAMLNNRLTSWVVVARVSAQIR
jgi:phosphate-selective porin OprO/OprP